MIGDKVLRPSKTARAEGAGRANALGRAVRSRLVLRSRETNLLRLALVAMLVVPVGLLLYAQAQARDALDDRFALRATLGAGFVASYAQDIMARQQSIAEAQLSGTTVPAEAFAHVVETFAFEAAVLLDRDGRLMHVAPAAPGLVGAPLADRYEHLRAALGGAPTVSNAVRSAAAGLPIVAFAVPFETDAGRRVFSGGYHFRDTPLSAYLETVIPFSTASAYLVDAAGVIVDSNAEEVLEHGTLAARDPELAAAVAVAADGTYTSRGSDHRFTVEAVAGLPLRLILAVPSDQLYAPVDGAAQWAPWVVLGVLVLATLLAFRLLSALSRSQARLRAVTDELRRSNRELQEFASVASHDLQEPLRKIQAFGDRLATEHRAALDEDGRDHLARMLSASARMRTLIDELLAYSRVATQPHTSRPIDLDALVADVLVDLEQRVADSSGTVEVERLGTLDGDPTQIRQLLQNLIANALKYRRPDVPPQVHVAAHEVPGGWRIEVRDNGIGFDPAQSERIFAPFQRLHGRSRYEGTGMGLAICRRIAERHGGTISAEGRPGHGATFLVTLRRPDRTQDRQP